MRSAFTYHTKDRQAKSRAFGRVAQILQHSTALILAAIESRATQFTGASTLTAIRSAGTNYRTMQKLVIALMLSRAAAAKTGGDQCVPGDLLQMRCEGTATYQVKFTGQWTAENSV